MSPLKGSGRLALGTATIVNSILTLSPQLLALFVLIPSLFGMFSIVYLVYAFAVSLTLSFVSEPLIRSRVEPDKPRVWQGYISALLSLAFVAGVVSALSALMLGMQLGLALVASVAVASSAVRSGVRFWQLHVNDWRKVMLGDAHGVVGFWLAASICLATDASALFTVIASWMIAGVASLISSFHSFVWSPRFTSEWVRRHSTDIGLLLRDSILMDIGAIFTPLLLASSLSLSSFGTYRAVSNVASPVRLLLNPLRPYIGASARSGGIRLSRVRWLTCTAGILVGTLASLALWSIDFLGFKMGVISSLATFIIPVGIFVGGNFVGHFFYIRSRISSNGKLLFVGRIIQTTLMTIGPILGVLFGGLSGAIWSLGLVTIISACAWMLIDGASVKAFRTQEDTI
ncbi:hypothetical protein [Paeniglutamicibacter sulfureus]|uniref:Oligosaccharide flippase family protein n=1 Tax=Paeniglutamicibacter sulfureus TaxID=43666 RepID=A0ABU2BMN9_9MICC|nr:hypothetical protein [Paeniglutamicibacter sulfureus]MDR7359912.1 hypothetical protein [Paeniglutamicibacter sulfureus]